MIGKEGESPKGKIVWTAEIWRGRVYCLKCPSADYKMVHDQSRFEQAIAKEGWIKDSQGNWLCPRCSHGITFPNKHYGLRKQKELVYLVGVMGWKPSLIAEKMCVTRAGVYRLAQRALRNGLLDPATVPPLEGKYGRS